MFAAAADLATDLAADSNWIDSLGPFVPFGMLALGGIYFLQKEMCRREEVLTEQAKEERERAAARIKELEEQVRDLSNKAIEQQAVLGPLLGEAARVLSEAVDALSEGQAP